MSRHSVLLGLCLALLAGPAAAGTAYVTLASDATVAGIHYETVLKVTNTASEPKFFVTYFIPSFTDGTERPEELEQTPVAVPAGQTVVFTGLASAGGSGMLEVTGDSELVFDAVMRPSVGGVEGSEARVPVINSENLVDGGRTFVVQGFRRDDFYASHFGLVNLSHAPNPCNVDLLAADGAPLINRVVLVLQPLSQQYWYDVLPLVGIGKASDARFEVTCEASSYAFGQAVDLESGSSRLLDRGTDLLSTLVQPGQELACPAESWCFDLAGVYFVPDRSQQILKQVLDVPKGESFSRLTVRMTVTHGGWFSRNSAGLHNFFWLYSNRFAGGTWAYVNARGPNKNLLSTMHNITLPRGVHDRTTANLSLQPGQTYTVEYTYDTAIGLVETIVKSQAGQELARVTDTPTASIISFPNDHLELWFGLEEVHQEVPSFGWRYQDFHLELSK